MKKRILFVDDEPNILSSMKRMLRGMRKDVTMDFVESGRSALDAMAVEPYDVVISDMRMPGMDGAELLSSIRDTWPQTIRIMLTGQADSDSLLRTVNVVHKFLMKPCGQDDIKECIKQACELHSFLLMDDVEKTAMDILKLLPTLPPVYQEIQDLLLTDACSAELIAACLSRDEWMHSCILQLYQVVKFEDDSSSNTTMIDAVTDLGFEVIRPLVLSLHLFQQLLWRIPQNQPFERVLAHGMRVARHAKRLAQAEQMPVQLVLEGFIGGLLHDIGYLVLAHIQPEKFIGVYRDLLKDGGSFDSGDGDIVDFSHSKAGALLLVVFGFPLGIIEIVAYHHLPDHHPGTNFNGLTAVHVADSLIVDIDTPASCCRSILNHDYLEQVQCQGKLPAWKGVLQIAE